MIQRAEMDQVILATGGYDHTIKLWQTHSGICYRTIQHPESQVNYLEITPDKQSLASASYQHIYMYDLISNHPSSVATFEGPTKNVTDLGFQVDGKWMYSAGEDGKVRIWDLKAKNTQGQKWINLSAPINCVVLHPNQVELFIGDQNGVVHKWDLKTDHSELFIPETDAMIVDLALDPFGHNLAMVNNKGHCYVWDLQAGKMDEPTKVKPKDKFECHKRLALRCEYSPDGRYLATTSADQTARIWNTSDYSLKQELKKDSQRWVWDVAFSSDSQYVFTASSDGLAKIWNIESGAMEKEYAGHQKPITALAFRDCSV